MSNSIVLLFYPGEHSYIGLWNGKTNAWKTQEVTPTPSGNRVISALELLLQTTNTPLNKVTHIGVLEGPASYTELRIFITTANSLSWVLGVPLFAFNAKNILPNEIPSLLSQAHVNRPIEPIYPTSIV